MVDDNRENSAKQERRRAFLPAPLRCGDTIAILAPAGAFDTTLLPPAIDTLSGAGFKVKVMPHTCQREGSFSGSAADRFADFANAWSMPDVRAILCARGGYGAIHLLPLIDKLDLITDPKWVIGFSDISAIHALLQSKGIASVHASMVKRLAKGIDDPYNRQLIDTIKGDIPSFSFAPHPLNINGEAEGKIVGGNLSVLTALIATPYDIFRNADILFIEDINEPIYKIERMMYQLELSGVLSSLKAIVAGEFTGTKADSNHKCAEEIIVNIAKKHSIPVALGAPIGHGDDNVPIIEGANARLTVDVYGSRLTTLEGQARN